MSIAKLVRFATFIIALSTLCVSAAEFSIPATNDTPNRIMVLPPVFEAGPGRLQLPERSPGRVVRAGQIYRIGGQPIVAAHAGAIATNVLVFTAISTNDLGQVTTNTTQRLADISVPEAGLSEFDGTVRWMRPRKRLHYTRIRVSGGAGASVVLSDWRGNSWTYKESADDVLDEGFSSFPGALYGSLVGAYGAGTNATVSVWSW